MTSLTTEPPTLRSIPSIAAFSPAAPNRRSYRCYNCNHSFHITPTAANASSASPSSFHCPSCHYRHLISHHTISPPPPASTTPRQNPDYAAGSSTFAYQTSDDSDYDEEDYDSDSSLLSFTALNSHPRTPALKSFVGSLPIKTFSPNSTPSLSSCSICIEDFDIKPDTCVTINELPCEHYFHRDCIVEWLQRSNTCPLCRYKLPVDPSGPVEVADTSSNRWEVEYDTVLVVDLAPTRNPMVRRMDSVEEGLVSSGGASASDRRVLEANGVGDLDVMHDEDGDVLMIDA
ncbi:RING/U-box superfamily protein [Striga hermonthica]|uniref:RING/U-box superfamily protein n=1 Tax=Striga hermonthica TaxID=68872 RepID=A0A9N7RQB5_STRHE|nr:RING/U-box superfamily protein [Striga hermonthica]